MSLNSFLQFFVTKETKFFPIYIKQSELLIHATKTLLEMVKIDNYEERKLLGRQIKKDETDGDELFRNLYKMLNISFNSSGHGSGGAHICTNSGHCL
jgi:uncharacterized protein Yka (UPF0111/DUF47 family)